MLLTSSEAAKLLRKLNDEIASVLRKESLSKIYTVSAGEDENAARPEYDFCETQSIIEKYESKIRKLKHAINLFNTSYIVPEIGMTIDEILILIPQLTRQKSRLDDLKGRLPKSRISSPYGRSSGIVEYEIANYSIDDAENEYKKVAERLSEVQLALDKANTTVTFEINID